MDRMNISIAARAMGGTINKDAEFTSVCIDNRAVVEGCLFFAIKGENFNGHLFVKKALEAGAAAAVCSEEVEGIADAPVITVADTRAALMRLAAYNRSLYEIPVVGLTGSVGKTTTKDMVAAVLGAKYNTLATEGNLNNEIGLPRMCMRLGSEHEAAVLEMGMSHFGEISRLTRTARPTIGLITNIGVSHIENLGSRDGILRAKLEIIEGMAEGAPLVLCGDDDKLLEAADGITDRETVLYGIDNLDVDCRASDIRESEDSITFTLTWRGESYEIFIPTIGRHNVYNACAAFVCGQLAGVSPREAIDGLRAYCPDARRQKIVRKKGITFIEDCYNASPDSIRASVGVLASIPCTGRRIAVLGDMLELGDYAKQAHCDCGKVVRELGVDILLAYGNNAKYYIEGAGDGIEGRLYDDKAALADDLLVTLREGDAVLFKASRGMKLEDVFERLYKEME